MNDVHDRTMLWRRIDLPGHESARLRSHDGARHLEGTAVFADGAQACRLDYRIACDEEWRTRSASVTGWVGDRAVERVIEVDAGRWHVAGVECLKVAGCIDVDLEFSPSTNLLPIRRLGLAIGEEARVRSAWLRFPSFELEPLEQVYRRLGEHAYRYASDDGRFVAEIEVDDAGFVTRYPPFWERENPA